MGFILAERARSLQLLTPKERERAVLAQYERSFGAIEEALHYAEYDWDADEFTGGCYLGLLPPGSAADLYAIMIIMFMWIL